jgi:hypothetical protein
MARSRTFGEWAAPKLHYRGFPDSTGPNRRARNSRLWQVGVLSANLNRECTRMLPPQQALDLTFSTIIKSSTLRI